MPVSRAVVATGGAAGPHEHVDYADVTHSHDLTHTHAPAEIGAAPQVHTHDLAHTHDLSGYATADHAHASGPHIHTEYAPDDHDHGPENEHYHDDNHIPASIARNTEVSAAVATHAAGPHGTQPHSHIAADLPTELEESAEILSVVAAHEALTNPHPGYATDADLTTHAATPHGGVAHSHVDADLPAGLARDAEVAAMYAPIHSHPFSSDTHNHDTAYAPTHGHPYAATSHAHVDADLPATITRDSELTSAISTHEAAANPHSTYLTQAEGDAAYATTGHAHAGGGVTAGVIRKTANQTMTLTAQTAVTDMSFPAAANSSYFFQMAPAITTSTGTSPTSAWGFTGPAGATVSVVGEIDTSTSIETNAVIVAFGNFPSGAQVANSGARFWGVVVTGATAGTVQLTVARGGTAPSMVVAAGSNGMWMKVA